MSPAPAENWEASDPGTGELKELFKEIVKCTRVVLATPVTVSMPKSVEVKAQWMKAFCDIGNENNKGVYFAYPTVYIEQNYVLRYISGALSLAKMAISGDDDKSLQAPCIRVKETLTPSFLYRWPDLFDKKLKPVPINWKAFKYLDIYRATSLESLERSAEDLNVGNRVVFIGGDYSDSDIYNTPLGPLHGIYLQAATYYSQDETVSTANKLVVFILDVIVGVLFGLIFHYTWARFKKAQLENQKFHAFIFSSLHLFALLAGLYLILLASGLALIMANYWIQPAPLVLGCYLDNQFSQTQNHKTHASSAPSNNLIINKLLNCWECLILIVVSIFTVLYLLFH